MVTIRVVPGAGGKESADFARILREMYKKRAERRGLLITQDENQTLAVDDPGFAAEEHGIHRLVRVSPFDAAQRRHTSFATVVVNEHEILDLSIRRSYVFAPYRCVKDHFRNLERADVDAYLEGNE